MMFFRRNSSDKASPRPRPPGPFSIPPRTTGGFVAAKGRNTQRLYYRPTGATFETIIDIIPFGKLETAERTIAWPPDLDAVMNVAAPLVQV